MFIFWRQEEVNPPTVCRQQDYVAVDREFIFNFRTNSKNLERKWKRLRAKGWILLLKKISNKIKRKSTQRVLIVCYTNRVYHYPVQNITWHMVLFCFFITRESKTDLWIIASVRQTFLAVPLIICAHYKVNRFKSNSSFQLYLLNIEQLNLHQLNLINFSG